MKTLRPIVLEPLSARRFAPFGDVIENDGSVRRNFYPETTVPGEGSGELRFWVSHVEPAPGEPLRVRRLERHPHAAQTFVPLQAARWIVIVAPSGPDGGPVLPELQAFLAGPGQGVSYRRGTWHHGTTVLDAPGRFAVLMWRRTAGDDDQFFDLPHAAEIDLR